MMSDLTKRTAIHIKSVSSQNKKKINSSTLDGKMFKMAGHEGIEPSKHKFWRPVAIPTCRWPSRFDFSQQRHKSHAHKIATILWPKPHSRTEDV